MTNRIRAKQIGKLIVYSVAFFLAFATYMVASDLITPVAAQDAVNAVYLPMIGTGQGNEPQPQPGGPSSEFLIESARQAGTINDETALLYRVFAAFEDLRLPFEYRGDDSTAAPSLALRQAQAQMATLSPETQAILAPFLLPPMDTNSWVEQRALSETGGEQQAPTAQNSAQPPGANRVTWSTTCQSDPNIKVWYQKRHPEDADDASDLCELVAGTIWPRLRGLLHTPPEDTAQANNGGDGQLDLYLVNAQNATVGYDGCHNTPSYILVNRAQWSQANIVELVMSAFLNGYLEVDCAQYMWLYAASRTWAIDYVLPEDNHEQSYADDYLEQTRFSLNIYNIASLEDVGNGAYLYLWYATNFVGEAKAIMPAIWENAINPDSLAVVNNAVPGGFARNWSVFSELNWNNEPVETYFMTDKLLYSTKPELDAAVTLDGAPDRSYELDGKVNYLAARTYHFTFNDPSVRSVLFINPFHGNVAPTARVDALYQMAGGSWVLEEWTGKVSKEFCRDLEAERIVELTLIISNNEWQDRNHKLNPPYPPRLNVTNVACRGWKFEGNASLTVVGKEIKATEATTVTATFRREKLGDDSTSHPMNLYRVTEGESHWSHNGVSFKCKGHGSGTYQLTGGLQTVLFTYNNATDTVNGTLYVPGDRRYIGFGTEGLDVINKQKVTYVCPNGSNSVSAVPTAYKWFQTELVPTQKVSENGQTITGSYTDVTNDGIAVMTTVYTWKMTALPPE